MKTSLFFLFIAAVISCNSSAFAAKVGQDRILRNDDGSILFTVMAIAKLFFLVFAVMGLTPAFALDRDWRHPSLDIEFIGKAFKAVGENIGWYDKYAVTPMLGKWKGTIPLIGGDQLACYVSAELAEKSNFFFFKKKVLTVTVSTDLGSDSAVFDVIHKDDPDGTSYTHFPFPKRPWMCPSLPNPSSSPCITDEKIPPVFFYEKTSSITFTSSGLRNICFGMKRIH